MTDKKNLDREIDDIFEKYSDCLAEVWGEEIQPYWEKMNSDDDSTPNVPPSVPKPKKSKTAVTKYILHAAVIALVMFVVVVIPSSDASAWKIWQLDFFSHGEDDHTKVGAENEYSFAKYYVKNLPEGYELDEEILTAGVNIKSIYKNGENILIFSQQNKDGFVSQIDSERGTLEEKRIGDFKVLICQREDNINCEITTDSNIMMIYTTDTYEVCEKFIENLIEK